MTLKILVLFDLPAPNSGEPYADQFSPEDWQPEKDVINALRRLGHEVRLLGIYDEIRDLVAEIRRHPPDLVFNLLEAFAGDRRHEASVAGLLDLFGVPYTGSPAATLSLCRNKLFTARVLTPHRIKVPRAVDLPRGGPRRSPRHLRFPVFVKPVGLEGSDGIAQSSFAENAESCLERVRFLHENLRTDALVEEYIEGRELYAGVIGNRRLRTLPLRELVFDDFPEERPRFATFKAKWDEEFRKRWGIRNTFAGPVPAPVLRRIDHISRTAFRVLQLRGYGRLDLRLTADNEIYVIEVNPNPSLERSDEIAQSAAKDGLAYPELIRRIVQWAMRERETGTRAVKNGKPV
mgnify:CR=1 FL=1